MHLGLKMMHRNRMRSAFQRNSMNKITPRKQTSTENGPSQESGSVVQDCEANQILDLGKHNPSDFEELYISPITH